MFVEVVGALVKPFASIVEFVVVIRPPAIDEFTMVRILCLGEFVHLVPYGTRTLLIEEVAHIDGCSVQEFALEVGILHQSAEQTGSLVGVGPAPVGVVGVVVHPLDGVVVRGRTIESQSEVGIFGNPAPLATLSQRTPDDIVVAREVLVVEIHILHHQVDILLPVHPLGILC